MSKKSIFVFLLLFLSVGNSRGQQVLVGTVNTVIDGRTVEVQTSPNRVMRVRLQALEVPEPQQALSEEIREHLGKLALGKTARIEVRQLIGTAVLGRVVVDGVDLTQQMLRDGAGWYAVLEQKSHVHKDSAAYRETEAVARAEKRGVWGQSGLKPAWEYRAEVSSKQAALDRQQYGQNAAPSGKIRSLIPPRSGGLSPANDKVQIWADVTSGTKKGAGGAKTVDEYEGLEMVYNERNGGSVLVTPTLPVEISGGATLKQMRVGFGQFYPGQTVVRGDNQFVVAVAALSENREFVRSNAIVIRTAGGRAVSLGKSDVNVSTSGYGMVAEVLFYRVSRADLNAVAAGKTATIRVGRFTGRLSRESLGALKKLMTATR